MTTKPKRKKRPLLWEVYNWIDGRPNVLGLCELVGPPLKDKDGVVAILNQAMFLDNVNPDEVEFEGDSKCFDVYVRGFPALYIERLVV